MNLFGRDTLEGSQAVVRLRQGVDIGRAGVRVVREWDGARCRSALVNEGPAAVQVEEVVLFAAEHGLPGSTPFYGEGFQMLSQTAGTLGQAANLSKYGDAAHYKLPQPAGALTVYNLALLEVSAERWLLVCFTSCRRFQGSLRFWPDRLEVVLDTEGMTLAPGERWELEEVFCEEGEDRDALFEEAAAAIERHHPRLEWGAPPTGWCSWYFYGPRVTEEDILANLAAIKARGVDLRYIQIDDGFQSRMGDWLIPGEKFPSGMPALCRRIREEGFEPAIWLAPFSAERESVVLREHPEWFIQGVDGAPLASNEISYGGWRCGPWYMLDGTHPGALAYLEEVCRTMRQEWGVTYFKLDALTWGALPLGEKGRRHDPTKTRVEAHRQAMAAIRRGAGQDSFILGCNAPMWPSLGEVHGMRTSNDVSRTWAQLALVARETFWRTWQHGRLWINDPDCVVLANADRGRGTSQVTPEEFGFHAAAALASGGMVLAGDDMTTLDETQWATLEKLVPPSGVPARFSDTSWQEGWIDGPGGWLLCLFNWEDQPRRHQLDRDVGQRWVDYWTGETVSDQSSITLAPHGARVLWS